LTRNSVNDVKDDKSNKDTEIIDLTRESVNNNEYKDREILPIVSEIINLEGSEFSLNNDEESMPIDENFNNELLSIENNNTNEEQDINNELIIKDSMSFEVDKSIDIIKGNSLELKGFGEYEANDICGEKLTELLVKGSTSSFSELNMNYISSGVQKDNKELSLLDCNLAILEIQRQPN